MTTGNTSGAPARYFDGGCMSDVAGGEKYFPQGGVAVKPVGFGQADYMIRRGGGDHDGPFHCRRFGIRAHQPSNILGHDGSVAT